MSRVVDLTQEIYQGMETYAGHLPTAIFPHLTHERTLGMFESDMSGATLGILICDHGPTHVDSMSHMDARPEAPSIDEMPLETFFGPGTCLDISHVAPLEYAGADDLDAALEACGAELREGDVLLLRTGTFDKFGDTADYAKQYPGLDEGAADWLLAKKVKIFGVDSPSPDNPVSRTYPVHLMCRDNGITHYENLMNLDQLVGKRFEFVGLPLRIRKGTGSPVRAVAFLDE